MQCIVMVSDKENGAQYHKLVSVEIVAPKDLKAGARVNIDGDQLIVKSIEIQEGKVVARMEEYRVSNCISTISRWRKKFPVVWLQ